MSGSLTVEIFGVALVTTQERSDLYLTYLGAMVNNEDSQVANKEEGVLSGEKSYIAACAKLENKCAKMQRYHLIHVRS